MNAVAQAVPRNEPHVCHILRLIDAGPYSGNSDFTANAVLRKRPIGFGPIDDDGAAYVFPSQRMAVRMAHHLLYATGTRWMAEATPGRIASIKPTHACRGCGCTQTDACAGGCGWAETDLCTQCTRGDPPAMWSVYEKPADFPLLFVAREWIGEVPLDRVLTAPTLDGLRAKRPPGTVVLARNEDDEPAVIESWI